MSSEAGQSFIGTVYSDVEGSYAAHLDKTTRIYHATRLSLIRTSRGYRQFRESVQQTVNLAVRETANQLLSTVERSLGVIREKGDVAEIKRIQQRVQRIYQAIMLNYLMRYRVIAQEKALDIFEAGRGYTLDYLFPLYISIKATLIVSKQMMAEFIQSRLSGIKATLSESKDQVIMFVSGKFNEEAIKRVLGDRIDSFKQLTVEVVNKGLRIKVDKESLVENYDKFSVQLLELVSEVKQKSGGNIDEVKKKSKDLYLEVINRIRAKEIQIKTEMRVGVRLAIESLPQESIVGGSAVASGNCQEQ